MDHATQTPRRKTASRPVTLVATPRGIAFGDLPRHLGYALKRAQLRVFDHFIVTVAPIKLSPAQFSVLILLESNTGRNQTEIAAALGIKRPNFVTMLDALERRGLCSRTRSSDDRRSHVVALTAKGRTTLDKAKRMVAEKHDKKLATVLTETERGDLIEMLDRLATLI